ncbi:hypothetical protein H4R33_005188, partial [Dimargaris cristalligena]
FFLAASVVVSTAVLASSTNESSTSVLPQGLSLVRCSDFHTQVQSQSQSLIRRGKKGGHGKIGGR